MFVPERVNSATHSRNLMEACERYDGNKAREYMEAKIKQSGVSGQQYRPQMFKPRSHFSFKEVVASITGDYSKCDPRPFYSAYTKQFVLRWQMQSRTDAAIALRDWFKNFPAIEMDEKGGWVTMSYRHMPPLGDSAYGKSNITRTFMHDDELGWHLPATKLIKLWPYQGSSTVEIKQNVKLEEAIQRIVEQAGTLYQPKYSYDNVLRHYSSKLRQSSFFGGFQTYVAEGCALTDVWKKRWSETVWDDMYHPRIQPFIAESIIERSMVGPASFVNLSNVDQSRLIDTYFGPTDRPTFESIPYFYPTGMPFNVPVSIGDISRMYLRPSHPPIWQFDLEAHRVPLIQELEDSRSRLTTEFISKFQELVKLRKYAKEEKHKPGLPRIDPDKDNKKY